MIKIENLVKRFGDNYAVNDISFTVNDGEIVGFLGPNGAGKSTTMNMITGYMSSTSGRVTINGVDILEEPLKAKQMIGFLPELPPLYLDMTVAEYLDFIYDLKGCTFNRKKHIAEICEVVKITDVYRRIIRNLSKGYRQRVGIAQALIGNPKVIIFDEPTVGLDPKQIIDIRNLIKMLGRDHTVILSTHILSEVQAVCDRIVIINKGRIVADERTENISRVVDENRRLNVRICGPQKDILQAVRAMEGVSYVEALAEKELDATAFIIESEQGVDIRKPLFYAMAEKGWPIISLQPEGVNLEDVFMSAVNKPLGGKTKDSAKGDAK